VNSPPTGKRPRGRPRLDAAQKSVGVQVRMPAGDYDRLYARARAARVSVPELVRRDLARADRGHTKLA
jgi:hypothetical protein